jgi:hypothetical protein
MSGEWQFCDYDFGGTDFPTPYSKPEEPRRNESQEGQQRKQTVPNVQGISPTLEVPPKQPTGWVACS